MSWTCPYCQHSSVVTNSNRSAKSDFLNDGNIFGPLIVKWYSITCLNEQCRQPSITFSLVRNDGSNETIRHWNLLPEASVKPFPDYIPAPILEDYKEAVLIKELSPKASATLSRRCLQGMIRNVWEVKPGRLVDEIREIQPVIEAGLWKAIDAIRNIGNIGAHMENNINVIVDVDPEEAHMLIGLIELLLQEWYVEKHERQLRIEAVTTLAVDKKAIKNAKQAV